MSSEAERLIRIRINKLKQLLQPMQTCVVCQKQTEKCCSLCRKTFYCSPEHQEVHWHMLHKFSCEGRHPDPNDDFRIYAESRTSQPARTPLDDAKAFVELFSERLGLRKQVLSRYIAARETNLSLHKDVVKEAQELAALSRKVSQTYRPGLAETLEEAFGLITSGFLVKIDQLLDRVMLSRCYQLAGMTKELRQVLLFLGTEVEAFPESSGEEAASSYRKLLVAISDVAEAAGLDKIGEKMLAHLVRLVERFQGIWEQGYAYFNMGLWYARRTYYQKALRCFTYAYELILAHKSSRQAAQIAAVFKGDALFNIALCRHSLGEGEKSAEDMQEAYRLRATGLGKSSLEASECLLMMAKWALPQKKYELCLQLLTQCLRIRKANPAFSRQLQEANALVRQMYERIRSDRAQNEQTGGTSGKYFDRLLESQEAFKEGEKKQSFTKRLLEAEKELVTFKLVITPELADTLTSQQWSKVGELIELVDTRMEKEQAVRLLLESEFSLALNEEQRKTFIKLNKMT